MPPPIDLAGRRFGALTALHRTRAQGGTAWVCACDCGRETTVPTSRLSSTADDNPRAIRACEACRSRACAVCGRPYLTPGSAATCGDPGCRRIYRRTVNALAAAATEMRAPGTNARRQRERLHRMRDENPDAYAQHLLAGREAQRRRRAELGDEHLARRREWQRSWYQRTRVERREKFRAWLNNMPADRRAQWDARIRDAQRSYRQRKALALLLRQADQLTARLRHQDGT